MPRPSRFTAQSFTDAAIELVAAGGASAATLTAIAKKAGAPTGSIYHRFESRAAILASAWIAAHGEFSRYMRAALSEGSGLMAALMVSHWARQNPARARFLLLHDPGSLIGGPPPEEMRLEIERQEHELEAAFTGYIRYELGGADEIDPETRARAQFLVFDAPIALVSPHLANGNPVPAFIDAAIRELHAGVSVVGGQR